MWFKSQVPTIYVIFPYSLLFQGIRFIYVNLLLMMGLFIVSHQNLGKKFRLLNSFRWTQKFGYCCNHTVKVLFPYKTFLHIYWIYITEISHTIWYRYQRSVILIPFARHWLIQFYPFTGTYRNRNQLKVGVCAVQLDCPLLYCFLLSQKRRLPRNHLQVMTNLIVHYSQTSSVTDATSHLTVISANLRRRWW